MLKAGMRAPDFSNPDADMNNIELSQFQDKEVDGVMRKIVERSTFIIDKQGIIRHALYGVSSRGHAEEILQLVALMSKGELN